MKKKAKQPVILETPILNAGMSFGALSREAKMALAKASALVAGKPIALKFVGGRIFWMNRRDAIFFSKNDRLYIRISGKVCLIFLIMLRYIIILF